MQATIDNKDVVMSERIRSAIRHRTEMVSVARLRRRRHLQRLIKRGCSLSQIGNLYGVTPGMISHIMSGRRR